MDDTVKIQEKHSVACQNEVILNSASSDDPTKSLPCPYPIDGLNSYNRFEFCNYLSFDDCMRYYELWSTYYDKDSRNAKYNGPACTIKHVPRFVPDQNATILDICAGTGACSLELKKLGFNNVVALDGCKNMLARAKSRNLYKSYLLNYLEPGIQTEIPTGTYDCVICAGGFVNGHLKPEVCREFARILKPGGICIIGMREAFLRTVEEYRGSLEPFMDGMSEWTLIEKIIEPDWFGNLDGIIFVYKKNLF